MASFCKSFMDSSSKQPIKIGINTLFLIPGKVGGTETYARGLISGLESTDKRNKYIIFCNRENYLTFKSRRKYFERVSTPFQASSRPLRIFWEQVILPFQVRHKKIDVLLSLGYIGPLFVPCKSAVVIFDLNWFFHPEEFSFLSRFFWKNLVTWSARRADKIITSSLNSKRDIEKVLGISPEKIELIYGGVNRKHFKKAGSKTLLAGIKKKYGLRSQFILTASAAYKFKNLSRLINAFKMVNKSLPDLQLLIVGLGGKGKPEMLRKIKDYGLQDRVIVAGWVPDKEIPLLYSAADAYVHPSLYEGFGFPVLEAMSCGCPVVSSGSASLSEIVRGAGIIVDATNTQALAQGIKKVVTDLTLRKSLIKAGEMQCKTFSWERSANQTSQVLSDLSCKKETQLLS